jgi:hypothetical protein
MFISFWILLWSLAVWGIAVDRKYIRDGGRTLSSEGRAFWGIPALVVVILIMNEKATIIRTFGLLLAVYEIYRLQQRRKYPLPRRMANSLR